MYRDPCGYRSIRFNPRGQVIPCVYWPLDGVTPSLIGDLTRLGAGVLELPAFQAARLEPPSRGRLPLSRRLRQSAGAQRPAG